MALRVVASVASCLFAVQAWKCGVDDPLIGHTLHVDAVRQPQVYETPAMVEKAQRRAGETDPELTRRLQNQLYRDAPSFIPISVVHANGDTAPIRITVVWDVVNGNDDDYNGATKSRQCSNVGQVIQAKGPSGWVDYSAGCTEAMIGSIGTARYALMQERTNAAVGFWRATLKVKPTQDPIVVSSLLIAADLGIPVGTVYRNTDLVIVMSARPSPFSPIAGFAVCYQKDQRGRCTIGQFNWVPEVLNLASKDSTDTIESELHTALHEIMHILGGMSPGAVASDSIFLDDAGNPKFGSSVFVSETDPAYAELTAPLLASGAITAAKKRTVIVTPRVKEVVRKWTGCADAPGFPLEDVPLGKGSHWEARLAGPEFMSYGAGSGQVYISDLSLAFLEDTGQYVPNYLMAGPIIRSDQLIVDDIAERKVVVPAENTGNIDYTPPPPLPPGALRWGMGEGCPFFNGLPRKTWPSTYTCTTNRQYTCTPDGRMSAVCIVRGDWAGVSSKPSCGDFNQYDDNSADDETFGPLCDTESDAAIAGQLPSWYRFFTSDTDAVTASGRAGATVATTAGYNDAMDYVPVPVGYWNCMYPKPVDNASASPTSEYGADLSSLAGLFGSSADMDSFGGQLRCPQCRCFVSSLVEVTKASTLNPEFPKYGLCYRANCYRPDYLQLAIKSPLKGETQWYKCPAEGGKLYIPGFAGALTCPKAVDFCKHENVTGVKFPETDVLLEAIFWGVLIGGFLFATAFLACPCLRDRILKTTKTCCGVRVFEDDAARQARLAAEDPTKDDGTVTPPTPLPKCASQTLYGVNIFTLLIGLLIVGVTSYSIYIAKVYSFGVTMLGLGTLVAILSLLGVAGARKRAEHGPSCWILTYFFLDLITCTLLVWGIAWNLLYANYDQYVDRYYDIIVDAVPNALIANLTRTEAVTQVSFYLKTNVAAVGGLAIVVLLIFLVNLVAAGRIITGRVLNSLAITVINNCMLLFGFMMTIVGVYLYNKNNAGGNPRVVALVIACGASFLFTALLGYVGVFKKRVAVLIAYFVLTSGLTCLAAACCYACFTEAEAIVAWVEGQDDDKLGELASSLGLSLTKESIVTTLQSNLRQLGLAFGVVIILMLILLVNILLFIAAVRHWFGAQGRSCWGKQLEGEAAGKAKEAAAKARAGKHPVSSAAGQHGHHGGARAPIVMVDNRMKKKAPVGRGGGGPRAPVVLR